MDRSMRHALHERRMHGSGDFPLAAYGLDIGAGEMVVVECHWHAEAEFFYVKEGETLFQVDDDYFPVRAGQAVFIDGGDIHAAHSLNGSPCSFQAIVFDPHMLDSSSSDAVQQKLVTPLVERRRTFPRHIQGVSEWEIGLLGWLHNLIDCCGKQEPGYEAAAKGCLYFMLQTIAAEGRYADRSETTPEESSRRERLKRSISYIQQNYRRPIRIRELADQIPMSEGQFFRFFKSMTRQTPIEYLNAYRVNQAAGLLLHSERKIADIALDVGFDHISYFVKVFRRTMGCSPSEYRKQHKADSAVR